MVDFERAMDFYRRIDPEIGSNSRRGQMFLKFARLIQDGKEQEFRDHVAECRWYHLIKEPAENVLNMIASNIQKKIDEEDFS